MRRQSVLALASLMALASNLFASFERRWMGRPVSTPSGRANARKKAKRKAARRARRIRRIHEG